MAFLLYLLHECFCLWSKTPWLTAVTALFNPFFILMILNLANIFWFSYYGGRFRISFASILRALLGLTSQYLYLELLGILPASQNVLLCDLSGFLLSVATMLTNLEPYTPQSMLFLLINVIICLVLHRSYLVYTILWLLISVMNNWLFKYVQGDNDVLVSSAVYVTGFSLFMCFYHLFSVTPNLSSLDVSYRDILRLCIYILATIFARISYIYALKYNSTNVINLINLLKFVIVGLIIAGTVNKVVCVLLLNTILSLVL